MYTTRREESPVAEFVHTLPLPHQTRVHRSLALLAEYGPNLRRPYADHVRGPMRELRVGFGRHEYRLLYYLRSDQVVVLVHAFAKKTQQLPARELDVADARREDYEARITRGEVKL